MSSSQNSQSEAVRVKTEQLPSGSRLSHPINDGEDRLLLAAGVLLTSRIKERLIARGITEVLLHPDDAARVLGHSPPSTAPSKAPPRKKEQPRAPAAQQDSLRAAVVQIKSQAAALASSVSLQVKNRGPSLSERQISRGTTPYNSKQRQRLAKHFSVTTQLLNDLALQALAGRVQDDRPLLQTTENYVAELTHDTDNVIASSTALAPNPELTERAVRLAQLGMAIAIEIGWDENNVREVGLCGLVHDFGMFRFAEKLRDPQAEISTADSRELTDHPLYVLDLLKSMKNVSLAATQVHENPDGTGYPRGLSQNEIHPYAHLLHTADAYITLTSEMRGRQAFLSYDVIVYLLKQVKAGRMDEQAVRALLQVVSLFPIGSHVRLSDGSEAQVIRRNGEHYTTPIVQRVGADRKARFDSAHASIIDLAQAKMRVMSPLLPPDRQEIRLEESQMDQVLWEDAGD